MVLGIRKQLISAFLSVIFITICIFGENNFLKSAMAGETPDGKTVKPLYGSTERQVAKSFLERLSQLPPARIKTMGLAYDIHLECRWGINIKMMVSVTMKRGKNKYLSTFSLTEPKGDNLWGKLALFILGRHTKEYKKLVESIESTMYETFHFEDGRFMTDELTEILPKREELKGKKGFRVLFDYDNKRIKFWKDSSRKKLTASEHYANQVGPLTAYFNYLLYYPPETEIYIINRQQHRDTSFTGKEPTEGTCFGSQVIKLIRNNPRERTEFSNSICFEGDGFFDIVYGKNIYYNLSRITAGNLKAPDAAFLEGIINRSKKREQVTRMKALQNQSLSPELYDKELKAVESMDILSAKNVRIHLRQADVVF